MIEDVIVKKLERFSDERGWLAEFWRSDKDAYQPVMGYVTRTETGVVRGPHEHRKQADGFVFAGPGSFKLFLWENRAGKPNYLKEQSLEVGENNPVMVIVPPGVVHGYKCIEGPGYSFNLADKLYRGAGKKEEVDEIRWEKDSDSPFKIE